MAQDQILVNPVILCGGSGTRLWPLSRAGFPKQFLVLNGNTSLFQQAIERVNKISSQSISIKETLIVTGDEHRFLVLDQLRELRSLNAKILLEPEAKNTAPALTMAALEAIKSGSDPVLVVSPADQTIDDQNVFADTIQRGVQAAATGKIIILGIKPTRPDTGFGYIRQKGPAGKFGEVDVSEFIEKPDLAHAKKYFKDIHYTWNAGMFVLKASVWLKALKFFQSDIYEAVLNAYDEAIYHENFIRPDIELFKKIPRNSIDYAVMEKCPNSDFECKMISLTLDWNDLGSWGAVWQVSKKDSNNNVTHGDVLLEHSENNLIHSSHRLVSAVGVENLVIIETADALLVADRHHSQFVQNIVKKLSSLDREEHLIHRKVSRPWGWYDTIDCGDRFKVKRIQVNPRASLSLQKHSKRAEHWVVIKGIAEVICGKKKQLLKENESTFIPLGETHRLCNPSDLPLEIIEVQSGSYLGEDDIVRFDDGYGRS